MQLSRVLVVMLVISISPALASEANSPPEIPNADGIKSTLTAPVITEFRLGSLKVEFERTTLPQIVRTLGVGEIRHRGDAGDSENWLCFIGNSTSGERQIWISSGELGGDRLFVDDLIVTKPLTKVVPSSGCRLALGNCRCPEGRGSMPV